MLQRSSNPLPSMMTLTPTDGASIFAYAATAITAVINAWPGASGLNLPPGTPRTMVLATAAVWVATIFSKYLLASTHVQATTAATVAQTHADTAAIGVAAGTAPASIADVEAVKTAHQQALAELEANLTDALDQLKAALGSNASFPPVVAPPQTPAV